MGGPYTAPHETWRPRSIHRPGIGPLLAAAGAASEDLFPRPASRDPPTWAAPGPPLPSTCGFDAFMARRTLANRCAARIYAHPPDQPCHWARMPRPAWGRRFHDRTTNPRAALQRGPFRVRSRTVRPRRGGDPGRRAAFLRPRSLSGIRRSRSGGLAQRRGRRSRGAAKGATCQGAVLALRRSIREPPTGRGASGSGAGEARSRKPVSRRVSPAVLGPVRRRNPAIGFDRHARAVPGPGLDRDRGPRRLEILRFRDRRSGGRSAAGPSNPPGSCPQHDPPWPRSRLRHHDAPPVNRVDGSRRRQARRPGNLVALRPVA